METIIRTPAVASQTRQLKRPSDKDRAAVPAPAPPAAPAVTPQPSVAQAAVAEKKEEAPVISQAQLRLEVERELANARKQIEQELISARALAERDGYAAGLEKGEQAAKKAVAEQVERLLSVTAALHQAKASVIENAEDLIVEIAYTAICRIIGQAAVTPAAVAGMVGQLLLSWRERNQLVVRLNPQDLELVRQAPDFASLDQQAALRADASIRAGGCIVESDGGSLDARLETQLARLRETLLSVRASRSGDGGGV